MHSSISWKLTFFIFSVCAFFTVIMFEEGYEAKNAVGIEEATIEPANLTISEQANVPKTTEILSYEAKPALPFTHPVYYHDKVVVLMYHHIAENEGTELITISPERFKQHLQSLTDNHYNVISIEDYIHFIQGTKNIPPNAVVITFDDGYESFYKYAYPELKKRGMTATNFVVASYIGMNNPKLPFLNWDEILEMHRDGFSFYSHTYNSHRKGLNEKGESVSALSNKFYLENEKRMETEVEYRERVRHDLTLARELLWEKLGNEFNLLCFPYGSYNQTVIDIGKDRGIHFYFTTRDGVNKKADQIIYRFNAGTRFVSADGLMHKLSLFKETPVVGIH